MFVLFLALVVFEILMCKDEVSLDCTEMKPLLFGSISQKIKMTKIKQHYILIETSELYSKMFKVFISDEYLFK